MTIRTDLSDLLITTSELSGELAKWAVQQSPYITPDNLSAAIEAFVKAWPNDKQAPVGFACQTWPSYQALREELERVFMTIPEIMAWNSRRTGREGTGFASRFDQPEADDDFIDIGALANNIARCVWADACDFADFNADFDKRHQAMTD